ncbi:unnamed protein product [Haemonchus placei]|uniref:Conserved oligomeric Golgi complex subunit 5 n=1 Tax=Haemonchus placei TaxID=6290 RepID=A0A0N4WB13_HAEPC|nr:unnamed protein product [Haemonchus placei]
MSRWYPERLLLLSLKFPSRSKQLDELLEQTTALEALDCTQRNLTLILSNRFAKTLDSLLHDYRNLVAKLEGLTVEKDLTADALRCEDLLDSLEKRNEIVKRSEIVSEIKGVVADNADLLSISWLRDALTTRLKAVENEVRRSAADDMRRGLVSLNASLISSATRALENLEVLDAELEVQLSSAAAEVDSKLVDLSSSPESSMRNLQQCVNLIHSQLEQCALLGEFVEKLARIIRARVPLDATFKLPLNFYHLQVYSTNKSSAQCTSRVLGTPHRGSTSTKKLYFKSVLSSAVEEEIKRLAWDSELRDETEKNIQKCLSMVAKRLESELKLDTENLLLGDRLRSDQLKNYRLLEVANGLAAKWPSQATPLLTFEQEAVAIIMESIRESIFTIVGAMHREVLGNKDVSPYMQELIAYINRIEFHTSHFPSSIRRSASLSSLADYIIELFLINATLLRPSSDSIRQRLRTDLESLLDAVESKLNPSVKYPDRNQLLSLWHRDGSIFDNESNTSLPTWIYLHILISDSPNNLVSPHTSVDWTIDQYVKWCCDHTDFEIVSFLSGLLASYTTTVVNRHETQFVPHYPKMMELVRKATDSTT